MAEYIEREAIYEKIAEMEELARDRCLSEPVGSYKVQLAERTKLKHIIADFPSADVAPVVHGQWKPYGKEEDRPPYVCSACARAVSHLYRQSYGKYCPNCGARMDGGADDG